MHSRMVSGAAHTGFVANISYPASTLIAYAASTLRQSRMLLDCECMHIPQAAGRVFAWLHLQTPFWPLFPLLWPEAAGARLAFCKQWPSKPVVAVMVMPYGPHLIPILTLTQMPYTTSNISSHNLRREVVTAANQPMPDNSPRSLDNTQKRYPRSTPFGIPQCKGIAANRWYVMEPVSSTKSGDANVIMCCVTRVHGTAPSAWLIASLCVGAASPAALWSSQVNPCSW